MTLFPSLIVVLVLSWLVSQLIPSLTSTITTMLLVGEARFTPDSKLGTAMKTEYNYTTSH